MTCRHLVSLLALAAASADAQDLTEPALAALPDNITWTARWSDAKPARKGKSKGRVLLATSTVKSGHLCKTSSHFSDSSQVDSWFVDNVLLMEKPGHRFEVLSVDPEHPQVPIPGRLSELKWVTAAKFVSTEKFDGRPASFYESEEVPERDADSGETPQESMPSVKLKAWVDPETRRPVAYHDGARLWRYEFAPFDEVLTLPPALAEELATFHEKVEKAAGLRSRVP